MKKEVSDELKITRTINGIDVKDKDIKNFTIQKKSALQVLQPAILRYKTQKDDA